MHFSALCDAVAAEHGLSRADARKILTGIFEAIGKGLAEDGDVMIPSFGRFSVRPVARRVGRNPRTGAMIEIAPTRRPAFSPAKALKDRILD